MCEALQSIFKDEIDAKVAEGEARGKAIGEARGKAIGEAIGEARGKSIGEATLAQLMQVLFNQGRTDDAERAASDKEYRYKLMKELNIINS